jgi:hypothetical protein
MTVNGAWPKNIQHGLLIQAIYCTTPTIHQVLDHEAVSNAFGGVLGNGHSHFLKWFGG